jgi:hypothetical protein
MERNFTGAGSAGMQINFSRFEALVRKRESLLKLSMREEKEKPFFYRGTKR